MNKLVGEDLTKGYGGAGVLKGATLEIGERDVAVVMGPSGSGKTTLLNLLGLLDTPDGGRILLDGREVTRLPEREAARVRNRHFGFIFQMFHLVQELNVLENVYLPLWIREGGNIGRDELRERGRVLLREFGIAHKEDACPLTLSGGERQKVAICRSLICRPGVLLADEPTGSIDRDSARVFYDTVRYLNGEKGITFLIASHNEKFLQLATKAVYLTEGILKPVALPARPETE